MSEKTDKLNEILEDALVIAVKIQEIAAMYGKDTVPRNKLLNSSNAMDLVVGSLHVVLFSEEVANESPAPP